MVTLEDKHRRERQPSRGGGGRWRLVALLLGIVGLTACASGASDPPVWPMPSPELIYQLSFGGSGSASRTLLVGLPDAVAAEGQELLVVAERVSGGETRQAALQPDGSFALEVPWPDVEDARVLVRSEISGQQGPGVIISKPPGGNLEGPPAPENVTSGPAGASDQVVLVGRARVGTAVVAANHRLGHVVRVAADGEGAFRMTLAATEGDSVVLFAVDAAGRQSTTVEFVVESD